jgi:hypothetical protein
LGFANIFGRPFAYANNRGFTEAIRIGYSIGDGVKRKLELGTTDADVKTYLNSVKLSDLSVNKVE